jgi:HPt (histidine-containing phosphotransfer) domain-containing protein
MTEQPHFDITPLHELKEIGGLELVNELAEVFLSDTPELIASIQAALDSEDWETLARASHSLKSSSFYLGAVALSTLSANLEREAKAHGSLDLCRELGGQTPALFEQAKHALSQAQTELGA